MSIFGRSYGQKISGEVLLHGKPTDVSTIPRAMDAGLAYATEDRKTYGLVLIDHIKHNVTLANLEGVAAKGVVDDLEELSVAMRDASICGLGQAAPNSVTSVMKHFPADVGIAK